MIRLRLYYFQVFWTVVSLIVVDVVHYFARKKSPSKNFPFHDYSMLTDLFIVYLEDDISRLVYTPAALPVGITLSGVYPNMRLRV